MGSLVIWHWSWSARETAISSYLKKPDETVREMIELNLAKGRMGRVSQRTNSKGPLRSFGTDGTRLEAFDPRSIARLLF